LKELLLDTHIMLWILRDPARLSHRAPGLDGQPLRDRPEDDAGPARPRPGGHRGAARGAAGLELRWLPLDERTTARASLAVWDHRDPFDRMILSAAEVHDLPLVSTDARFFRDDQTYEVRLVA
jgi:PIN domain nuclease of toxin-antitoxin system